METRLTCQGRSCHYLRVGRKQETLMEKSILLTTLTSAPAGSTPETGRTVFSVRNVSLEDEFSSYRQSLDIDTAHTVMFRTATNDDSHHNFRELKLTKLMCINA